MLYDPDADFAPNMTSSSLRTGIWCEIGDMTFQAWENCTRGQGVQEGFGGVAGFGDGCEGFGLVKGVTKQAGIANVSYALLYFDVTARARAGMSWSYLIKMMSCVCELYYTYLGSA
jgi:hypothetical protein